MKEKILIKLIRQGEVESEDYTRKFDKYMRKHGYTDYEVIGYGENSFDYNREFKRVKEMNLDKVVVYPELEMMFPPARLLILAAQALQMGIEVYDIRNEVELNESLLETLKAAELNSDQLIKVMQEVPRVACIAFENDELSKIKDHLRISAHCAKNNVVMMSYNKVNYDDIASSKNFVKNMKRESPEYVLIRDYNQLIEDELNYSYSIIDELKKMNIEVIEAMTDISVTQHYEKLKREPESMEYEDEKKAVLVIRAKEVPIEEIGIGLAFAEKKNYTISTGMSLSNMGNDQTLSEIIKFAKSENADVIIIPNIKNLGLNEMSIKVLLDKLGDENIQLESIEEGVIEHEMSNVGYRHFMH